MSNSNVVDFDSATMRSRHIEALDMALDMSPEIYVRTFGLALRQAGGGISLLDWEGEQRLGIRCPEDEKAIAGVAVVRNHARAHGMIEAIRQSAIKAHAASAGLAQ
jgi:hypothetical protein